MIVFIIFMSCITTVPVVLEKQLSVSLDSSNFVEISQVNEKANFSYKWNKTLLSEGDASLERWFSTQGSRSIVVYIVRFPLSSELSVIPSKSVQYLSVFDSLSSGSATINGGFYETGPMGLVRHNGIEINPLTNRGGSGVLHWSSKAGVGITHTPEWHKKIAESSRITEALQSIDRLVSAGKSLVNHRDGAILAVRTGVAITNHEILLVLAADDRSLPIKGTSQLTHTVGFGLSLAEYADLLVQLGAVQALNMDGAVSSGLRVALGEGQFELTSQRGTINAVKLSLRSESDK